jgi:mannose-6-phosphate isomerase-like protein (cupin superfamily)
MARDVTWFRRFALVSVILLVAAACGDDSDSGGDASSVPELTVEAAGVTVNGSALEEGGTAVIVAADRIQMDDSGRGVVQFQDDVELELFRSTEAQIDGAEVGSGGSALVEVRHEAGHARVRVPSEGTDRVTLETQAAVITTLDPGTEFIVCHAPDVVTCHVTVSGAAEVKAQGETVEVKAGEATFVLVGEPPPEAICAEMSEVEAWLSSIRNNENDQALGELVAAWPSEPCA